LCDLDGIEISAGQESVRFFCLFTRLEQVLLYRSHQGRQLGMRAKDTRIDIFWDFVMQHGAKMTGKYMTFRAGAWARAMLGQGDAWEFKRSGPTQNGTVVIFAARKRTARADKPASFLNPFAPLNAKWV